MSAFFVFVKSKKARGFTCGQYSLDLWDFMLSGLN